MATTPALGPFLSTLLVVLAVMVAAGIGSLIVAWKLVTTISARALPRGKQSTPHQAPELEVPDLHRYPERLEALQDALEYALRAGESQTTHLSTKQKELAAKPGREELAQRYAQDLELLEDQARTNRRVLATVWKTRAILALRIHLAEAVRAHPELDHLPQPADVTPDQLDTAARAYTRACREVRGFVQQLERARGSLHSVVPSPSVHAELLPTHREEVEREVVGVQRIFEDLHERMDRLADTLDYLADRFHTQKVVEGSSGALDLGPEAGQILREVSVAIRALDELTTVGDSGLADVAVDGLSAEIANLEKLGMDVDLQADADREVERLLASLSSPARG